MPRNCETDCLDLSFQAIESQASAGINTLCMQLAQLGMPPEKAGDVKIALAEAINNVVEHAHADIAPADIRIECRLCRDTLKVVISDTGTPMPDLKLPSGIPPAVDTVRLNLPEGGFGWFLIRQLTSEIRYARQGDRNQLFLRFDFTDLS